MSKNDFFIDKKEWSKIKDELLKNYLKLYFSKVLTTNQPLCYIDCFAGKGLFDDGELGSPIIALNKSEEALENNNSKSAKISCHFIESKYGEELSYNVKDRDAVVYSGKYEDNIEKILKTSIGKNVFLYVDPCGIKSLHFDKFNLLKTYKFYSTEILLNLNSFGFFRDGCRLLGCSDFSEFDDGLEERENLETTKSANTIDNMDRVANGDYWQQIVHDYNNGSIDSHEAEERFVNEYCAELESIFDYVINIPIKVKIKNMPKYRMVFCTNHKHGIIEMSRNMNIRWEQMQKDERDGQSSLFEFDRNFDDEMIQQFDGKMIQQNVEILIKELISNQYIQYDDFLCKFIKRNGIFYNPSKISKYMKQMETDGVVEMRRNPAFTPNGRPATWLDYKKGNNLKVRLKS